MWVDTVEGAVLTTNFFPTAQNHGTCSRNYADIQSSSWTLLLRDFLFWFLWTSPVLSSSGVSAVAFYLNNYLAVCNTVGSHLVCHWNLQESHHHLAKLCYYEGFYNCPDLFVLVTHSLTQIIFWTSYCWKVRRVVVLPLNIRAHTHKYFLFPVLLLPLLCFLQNSVVLRGILKIVLNPPLLSVIFCCPRTQNLGVVFFFCHFSSWWYKLVSFSSPGFCSSIFDLFQTKYVFFLVN